MGIAIQGLCPLVQVFDMAASLRFYRDILGFEIVSTSGEGDNSDWVWLRFGSAEIMLNTAYERDKRPPSPDPVRVKWHGDTAMYLGCEDLDGAYAYLVEKGVPAKPPVVRDYGMRQVYFKDPDGYELCLQWAVKGSRWE